MTNATSGLETQSSPNSTIASRAGQVLEDYGEIVAILPVLAGIFVTNRLRLRGAQALLVNLLIAAMVRQGVVHLKKQAHPQTANESNSEGNHHQATPQEQEDYTIVHSIPGRIRLRIPKLVSDEMYAKRLQTLLSGDARVQTVRINRAAASLVIQYDGTGVSELELGMYLLNILEQAENPTP
ncbi:MAG: hypothetical protein F6K03_17815, partial [Kamptonema sp. SIO4C4]|nr:hypothetical protein [Kamptonema sp. SIO4C4]